MNYLSTAWFSTLAIVTYIVLNDPNFPRLQDAVNGKFFVIWKRFLFDIQWNPKYPWCRMTIERLASKNAEINARLLREELGLPLEDSEK